MAGRWSINGESHLLRKQVRISASLLRTTISPLEGSYFSDIQLYSSFWIILSDRVGYAGDNFVRYTGDTITMAQTQRETDISLFFSTSFMKALVLSQFNSSHNSTSVIVELAGY